MQHPLDEPTDSLCLALRRTLADEAERARAIERLCLEVGRMPAPAKGEAAVDCPFGPRVAVALADIHADLATLIASLLADRGMVGRRAELLDGLAPDETERRAVEALLAAIDRLRDWESRFPAGVGEQQQEYWRRLLIGGAGDARAVLVDLVYRLEGMRALDRDPDASRRRRYADMTLAVHAPIAHRLGLGQIKWELEDLSFRHLEPRTYSEIARLLDERRASREAYLAAVEAKLERALADAGIRAEVYGRPKHIYSIWGKMRRKKLSFEGLFDVRALRVQVDTVTDCYAALSVVHELFEPIESEYDDYIARPKPNGYQSLHTAVHADEGKVVEIQIRTERMHAFAEFGVAAHWRYKGAGPGGANPFDLEVESLREGLSRGEIRPLEAPSVHAFTPNGELVELPAGATVLDFAYRIHTHLGHRCRGAKVNGQIAPLRTEVGNGDTVEVLTQKEPAPSREWGQANSGFLRSASARAKVRNWFAQFDREDARERGRLHCERLFRRFSMDAVARRRLLAALGMSTEEQLFLAVGRQRIAPETLQAAARSQLGEARDVSRRPPPPAGAGEEAPAAPTRASLVIENQSIEGLKVTPARCCNPKPGERVMAFLSRSQGYKLHRPECRNLAHLAREYPDRVLPVEWPKEEQNKG